MELDTGAAVSIISEETYHRRFPDTPLERLSVRLKTYGGESIEVRGKLMLPVTSVGVLVLVLVLEYNSSTCKYSAHTQLSVLEIYLDLARTRLFVLEFCMYSKVKYSVLGPSTRGYNSSTAINRFPQMPGAAA